MQGIKDEVTKAVLTEKKVADILGVAVFTVQEYRKRGLLRSYKPIKKVYVLYEDLLDFVRGRGKKPIQENGNDKK